jgi:N-methylhydantoinase A
MLQSDLRYEMARSTLEAGGMPTDAAIGALYDTLEAEARARMGQWYSGEIAVQRSADMRYGEQVFEIAVPLDGVAMTADALRAAFHARHRALFTYDLPEEEVVLVTARAAALGRLPSQAGKARPGGTPATPITTRRIRLEAGTVEAPVHRFEALAPGQVLRGPGIVESSTTTILLLPGDTATMDARGWLDISLEDPTP